MFKRLFNLISTILSSFVTSIEASQPAALIESEKNNLRSEILRFNKSLADQAGHVYKLANQLKNGSERSDKLRKRIQLLLKSGDQTNAAKLALELSELQRQNSDLATRCRVADETFASLEKARDEAVIAAKARIAKLENLVSQTEIIKLQNDMAEMVNSQSLTTAVSMNSLAQTEEILEKAHHAAAGRARVAGGGHVQQIEEIKALEYERKLLEEKALSDFINDNSVPGPSQINKSMAIRPLKSNA